MGVIIPPCAVVTATVEGRVRRLAESDRDVRRGDVVAVLDGPHGPISLASPIDGRTGGALSRVAQTVQVGEGVLWLSRR